ncbi:hypothetical protein LLH06_07875 [Mucilaginibacter daejeonensis]|uniref:hypothetical protein n=1 Tax=Mucilaginibacter daejeonensis TaxID=398049 RepID=UPI001D17B3F2|nr:hypothetical protein [Mucilaginibacter daejeonensis]UEG54881.1 hypothetical protein LLH06_07875 [Mucilaginibacter daejeonensis]
MMFTRKIQLFIDRNDAAEVKAHQERLYSWQKIAFRSANYIYTHLYLQEQIKEILYLNKGTRAKLCSIKADKDGILTSSHMNSTYRLLSDRFKGEIPTDILNTLNGRLHVSFQQNRKLYYTGERSLTNFKRDIHLPFSTISIKRFDMAEDGKNFRFILFGVPFITWIGKGYDKRDLLRDVFRGRTKISGCYLKLERTRIFLYISYRQDRTIQTLDSAVIAEVSLSPQRPLTVMIGSQHFGIGNKEEFFYKRLAIQAAYKRAQQSVNYNRNDHGIKRQHKNLERFHGLEHRYCEQQTHKYSKQLIDICVRNQAGTILLVGQENKEVTAKEDPLLIRNWGYQGLKDKIAYKAAAAGIILIME